MSKLLKSFLFISCQYGVFYLQDQLSCPKSVQPSERKVLGSPIFQQNVPDKRRVGGFDVGYVLTFQI